MPYNIQHIPKKLWALLLAAFLVSLTTASMAVAQVKNPNGGGGNGGLIPRGKIHPDTSPGFFKYFWAIIGLVAAIYGVLSILDMLSGARKGISSLDDESALASGVHRRAFTKAGASAAFSALCLGGGIFLIVNQGLSAVGLS